MFALNLHTLNIYLFFSELVGDQISFCRVALEYFLLLCGLDLKGLLFFLFLLGGRTVL